MSLRYSAGYQSNLLQRASSVTVTNEDTDFPKANIYDGTAAVFKGSTEVVPFTISADLGEIPANGGFESAFSGGVPGTGWSKTAGATLVRNTTEQRTGTGALECQGSTANYASFLVTVHPGQRLKLEAAGRTVSGTGTFARVRVRNLWTGSLLDSSGNWQSGQTTAFLANQTTTYVFQSVAFTVEQGSGFPYTMTLRFELYCATIDFPVYDDVAVFYAVNFASLHWSNFIDQTTKPALRSSTDNFSGSDTLEAEFTPCQPAMYVLLSSPVYRRYWRYNSTTNSNVSFGGSVPVVGEAWLGYAEAAARAQDYGWELSSIRTQIRTSTVLGAEGVYVPSDHEQRSLSLNFRPGSAAEFLELRERLHRMTKGGADPFVIVPYDSDDIVIHGRLKPTLGYQRELVTRWIGMSMEILETLPPVLAP